MAKEIFYNDEARNRLLAGAEVLYNAVKTTMGPKGRNVVIDKSFGSPTITHDGVTVAKAVDLPNDKREVYGFKVGAELIKQAASKMNDIAGDGTTTVTILTYHILNEANKIVAAGNNPMHLRRELEEAGAKVIRALQGDAEEIGSQVEKIAQVATISAGDESIGKEIAQIMDKVGKDGVVTVEEGQSLTLESDVVEGFTFEKGFISPYMVTDPTRLEAVYDKPAIVVTDKKISNMKDILSFIEKVAAAGQKNLVLIAEDVDGEALGTLVLNKLKGVFNTVAIKAPAFGDNRTETLQDIAILTGATLITADQGLSFENVDLSVVGSARKVIVGKDDTTIIEGAGSVVEVKSRIAQIKRQSETASSDYDSDNYKKRGAALNGKVAIIKVGGATETEIEEKKFRVDDAVAAVKAALEEGIVSGGGIALLNAMPKSAKDSSSTPVGAQILYRALEQPFRILLENAGLNPDEWLPQIYSSGKIGYGVDINKMDNKLVDMKEHGIVDPLRVTREAVQNAVSIAGTAMTMGALIVSTPAKDNAGAGMDGGGMAGMGM